VPTTAEQRKLKLHAMSNEVYQMIERALRFTDLLKSEHRATDWLGEGFKNQQGTPAKANEMSRVPSTKQVINLCFQNHISRELAFYRSISQSSW
jgi:hypothetical protein